MCHLNRESSTGDVPRPQSVFLLSTYNTTTADVTEYRLTRQHASAQRLCPSRSLYRSAHSPDVCSVERPSLARRTMHHSVANRIPKRTLIDQSWSLINLCLVRGVYVTQLRCINNPLPGVGSAYYDCNNIAGQIMLSATQYLYPGCNNSIGYQSLTTTRWPTSNCVPGTLGYGGTYSMFSPYLSSLHLTTDHATDTTSWDRRYQ